MFWGMLWLIMMITLFLPAVSMIGFADSWFDFRRKFAKKAAEIRKRENSL